MPILTDRRNVQKARRLVEVAQTIHRAHDERDFRLTGALDSQVEIENKILNRKEIAFYRKLLSFGARLNGAYQEHYATGRDEDESELAYQIRIAASYSVETIRQFPGLASKYEKGLAILDLVANGRRVMPDEIKYLVAGTPERSALEANGVLAVKDAADFVINSESIADTNPSNSVQRLAVNSVKKVADRYERRAFKGLWKLGCDLLEVDSDRCSDMRGRNEDDVSFRVRIGAAYALDAVRAQGLADYYAKGVAFVDEFAQGKRAVPPHIAANLGNGLDDAGLS